MKKLILILALLPLLSFGQMTMKVMKYGSTSRYELWTPPDSVKIKGVILYLHGSGEIGTDSTSLRMIERNDFLKQFRNGVIKPYIVIAPQLLKPASNWMDGVMYNLLNIVDVYATQYHVSRHVTGLSLGGIAAWKAIELGYKLQGNKPGYWATAVPVAGSYVTSNMDMFKGISIKIYHGTSDPTVKPGNDVKMFPLLTAAGVDAEAKFYQGAGHSIWPWAYDNSVDGYWNFMDRHYGSK